MKKLFTILMAAVAGSAFADVTETIVDRVVTLSGTGNWTTGYSSDNVDSVVLAKDSNITWTPSMPSTYTGGTIYYGSLLYLGANGALGTGALDMSQGGALSVASGANITVPNKVIFSQNNTYGYACAMNGVGSLTLQSVGSPANGSTHHIRLGRASASDAGTTILSLTQPDSEALDQIKLAGKATVYLDGGTIKARSDANGPFLSKVWANSEPEVIARNAGVTFDVPVKTSVIPGEELKFVRTTRTVVKETYYPENWSFENGSKGWTLTRDEECKEWSEISQNGSPYDGNGKYPTTNGTHYAMIRRGNELQQTIQVPTAGRWRVVLERGCRDGNHSIGLDSWVMVGDTKVMDMPKLSSPEGFTQYTSAAIELAAGQNYLLSIEVEPVTAGNTSFNFDVIRLERIEEEVVLVPFGKSGEGDLYMGLTAMTNAAIAVTGGTLYSSTPALTEASLDIADGATFALDGSKVEPETAISVAAGGTLKLTGTMDNLLVNGSFEAGYTADYTPGAQPGWTGNGSWYGYSASNGTTLSPGVVTPCGRQVLFLRDASAVSQTVNVPAAGQYQISFLEVPRPYGSAHQLPIVVTIDGKEAYRVAPRATKATAFVRHTTTVTLTEGAHTFKLATEAAAHGTGNDLLLDDVSLRSAEKTVVNGTLALATGSKLVLNNASPIRWENVTVDGEKFEGGKAALKDAGVDVEGDGSFRAGGLKGLMIILK